MRPESAPAASTLPRSILVIANAFLLTQLGWWSASILPVFAGKNPPLEAPFIAAGDSYFVALNGNDAGPGSAARPWATINRAAEQAKAGDLVVVRGGHYMLSAQVRPRNSGRPGAWISFVGYPGEEPILDAKSVARSSFSHGILNEGIFQLERVSHIRVANLAIINSHDAGFTIRDSSDIELINNSTNGTFSSGIAVWDTNHDRRATRRIRIIGNVITRATTWDQAPPEIPKRGEPPHEALSLGGAVDFEVAYNHIYASDKEGIDIKETSSRGKVHHNLVHDLDRQGIYLDAWFGEIKDIEVFSNLVHDCRGAGLAISVEEGNSIENVSIYHNLIFDNDGSGLYFSRWGADNPRRKIQVYNNVFYHNGYGPPAAGQIYHWQTGGLYLYSTHVQDVSISNNIFSENRGFQIGYSELFLKDHRSWRTAMHEQKIRITHNLIYGRNTIGTPIVSGGVPFDRVKIYAVNGDWARFGDPLFRDPANQDFRPLNGSPAMKGHSFAGAYPLNSQWQTWWKQDFPPRLVQTELDRSR